MADFNKLIDICKGKKVYIQTHNFPDPDAIGSAFGLKELFSHFGIDSTICYDGKIDKLSTSKMLDLFHIEMLSSEEVHLGLKDEDYIICVDSQKEAGNITDFTGQEIASIDHHPTYKQVDYLYSDIQIVGACATLITEYYQALGLTPGVNAATALLYAIKMDTLQFTRGVTVRDIRAFAFLMPLADSHALHLLEMNNIEFRDLKAYGAAIENIEVYDYVGISSIPFSCPDAMIAIISDFILSLVEVEVAIIYCRRNDGMKFSVRSERDDVHAGEITHAALKGLGDGGGHAAMAGGIIPQKKVHAMGNYPDSVIRERFLDAIKKR